MVCCRRRSGCDVGHPKARRRSLTQSPALFSMAIAFVGIWLFSVTDRSRRAEIDRAAFDAQYVRCQTGIGASKASAH